MCVLVKRMHTAQCVVVDVPAVPLLASVALVSGWCCTWLYAVHVPSHHCCHRSNVEVYRVVAVVLAPCLFLQCAAISYCLQVAHTVALQHKHG